MFTLIQYSLSDKLLHSCARDRVKVRTFLREAKQKKRNMKKRNKPLLALRHLSSVYVEFHGKEIITNPKACGTPNWVKSGGQNTAQRHQRGFSAARCLTKLSILLCRKLSRIKTSWNQNKHNNLPSFTHAWKGLAPAGGNATQQCRSPGDTGSARKTRLANAVKTIPQLYSVAVPHLRGKLACIIWSASASN